MLLLIFTIKMIKHKFTSCFYLLMKNVKSSISFIES